MFSELLARALAPLLHVAATYGHTLLLYYAKREEVREELLHKRARRELRRRSILALDTYERHITRERALLAEAYVIIAS